MMKWEIERGERIVPTTAIVGEKSKLGIRGWHGHESNIEAPLISHRHSQNYAFTPRLACF